MMHPLLDYHQPIIPLAAAIAPTLGQQQNAAALRAFAISSPSESNNRSAQLPRNHLDQAAGGWRIHSSSPSGGDGLREPDRIGCPYCRRRTYLVRVRPLGNLLSYEGRCTTCGTKGRKLKDTLADNK
jgi:hypothetical protein